jgi:UPF0716 family protein affecting phage T7 exclusion
MVAETVIGYLLLVAGVIMLATPGPGIVTIVAGLAVLARHFHWADRVKTAALVRIRDGRTALQARRAAHRAGPGSDRGQGTTVQRDRPAHRAVPDHRRRDAA